jgi:hypothetical protein
MRNSVGRRLVESLVRSADIALTQKMHASKHTFPITPTNDFMPAFHSNATACQPAAPSRNVRTLI